MSTIAIVDATMECRISDMMIQLGPWDQRVLLKPDETILRNVINMVRI